MHLCTDCFTWISSLSLLKSYKDTPHFNFYLIRNCCSSWFRNLTKATEQTWVSNSAPSDYTHLFLIVPETWKSTTTTLVDWCLVTAHFIEGCCLTVTSHDGRYEEALWGLFHRTRIPFMKALPSCPNHLPKTPSPNTLTLGIKFQHKNWGET